MIYDLLPKFQKHHTFFLIDNLLPKHFPTKPRWTHYPNEILLVFFFFPLDVKIFFAFFIFHFIILSHRPILTFQHDPLLFPDLSSNVASRGNLRGRFGAEMQGEGRKIDFLIRLIFRIKGRSIINATPPASSQRGGVSWNERPTASLLLS